MLPDGLFPNHSDRLVRRKIMTVIFQRKQIKRRNQTIGGVAGSDINLMIVQRRSEQAQIHGARRGCKAQAVKGGQTGISVGTLHELIAKTSSPLRSKSRGLRKSF